MKNQIHMLKSVTDTICLSLIITTEDGKILVVDGGTASETDYFVQYLKEITGSDSPHVDGWFLTHPHDDHISVFMKVVEDHGEITFDRVYFNFPSVPFLEKARDGSDGTMNHFMEVLPKFADKIRFTSGGDRFTVGAAEIEVLYTHDPEFTENVCNNSSMVFTVTLDGKKLLVTGDCGVEAGRKILRLCPEKLKADICQMAHHGQEGCDLDFYKAVSPEICLWPTPTWLWNNDAGQGYNTHTWETIIVREWMGNLGVKTDLVMKDGTQIIDI